MEAILKSAIISNVSDIRNYFDNYKPYMAMEKADVLEANERFFHAISLGNADLMKALWYIHTSHLCSYSLSITLSYIYSNLI